MKKPSKTDLIKAITAGDVGFARVDFGNQHGKTNHLKFDNRTQGNELREFVTLKYGPTEISVLMGSLLYPEEKSLTWEYKDFTNVEELANAIAAFTIDFADSFEQTLTRK